MANEGVYGSLQDVWQDEVFPRVDCQLRQGRHIGREDLSAYTFLLEAFRLLNQYYRPYSCELVHAKEDVGDYFYLSSYGQLLGQRKLPVQAMKVGMALGYMVSDPEYIERSIPVERLVSTLKMLLGEERFQEDFAKRFRSRNVDRDEEKALKAVEAAVRQLADLGFVNFSRRGSKTIRVLSPIFRFLEPIRGVGRMEEAIESLIKNGVVTEVDEEDYCEDEGDSDE